ncbi:MAG: ribulose-5-phosphate 4-epimerase/fuculose-1-phosphate aldolase [Gammaproteobacteria bacterium]|jgi:ribulose-5-phosphate 4-epimerase/fuculose-1-phosphate aldolase
MSIHALSPTHNVDPITQARIDLAAAHRLSVLHELDEGIDNHFTVTVPGTTDRFLVLPFGLHWSEARAGDLIVFDETGATVQGEGTVELSACCIHAPIHRITGAKVVMHTHQTWALALNMLDDNRLIPASQTAAYYHGRVAYDDSYAGTADSTEEGERLAKVLDPSQHTIFMKNHGVVVVGENVAQAYRRLYLLERVCRAQLIAMSTGGALAALSEDIIAQVQTPPTTDSHERGEREQLFFSAMKRVLDRELPGYAD